MCPGLQIPGPSAMFADPALDIPAPCSALKGLAQCAAAGWVHSAPPAPHCRHLCQGLGAPLPPIPGVGTRTALWCLCFPSSSECPLSTFPFRQVELTAGLLSPPQVEWPSIQWLWPQPQSRSHIPEANITFSKEGPLRAVSHKFLPTKIRIAAAQSMLGFALKRI